MPFGIMPKPRDYWALDDVLIASLHITPNDDVRSVVSHRYGARDEENAASISLA